MPGANQLLSLRNAVRQGTRDATVALAGRFTAFAVLVVLAATGLGAVLAASATAFAVIEWAGVGYLALLGLNTLRIAWRDRAAADRTAAGVEAPVVRGRWWLVRQEFLVAITNPKALLLFVAFLPQFVPAGSASAPNLVVLGAAYIGVEAAAPPRRRHRCVVPRARRRTGHREPPLTTRGRLGRRLRLAERA